ncbi:hypothetical protein AB0B45_47480 [Nonomuraea sp. NPDC049152]|uniref:hypothetical protein n=1 Tax=Nonomuraea sp. NPDC049152 TaxID=3154350 RepID=UPI0033DF6696
MRLGEGEGHHRTLQRIEVKAMREAAETEMGRRGRPSRSADRHGLNFGVSNPSVAVAVSIAVIRPVATR